MARGIKVKPLVSIIILNWNQRDLTLKCLGSVFKSDYQKKEVILVDNGSKDGSYKAVKENFPEVKIIRNRKNEGYARGNNQGFNISKGNFILFLNNDTEIDKNTISELVNFLLKNKGFGAGQAKIYWSFDRDKNDLVGTFLTPTGFLYYYGYGKKDQKKYKKKRKIFFAKGTALMVRKEVIEKVGLFDEDFITYFEEYDFCWRVWLAGWKIGYCPTAIVYHEFNATGRMLGKPYTFYLTNRNRIASIIKNLSFPFLFLIFPLHLFLSFFTIIFFLLKEPIYAFSLSKAWLWNVKNLKKTLRKRIFVQKEIRKVSDLDLFLRKEKNLVFPPLSYYIYLLAKDMRFYKDINI